MDDTHDHDLPPQEESKSCPQCPEYLAGWKRAQADYQNLKKDTERERQEFAKYANERLLEELIPIAEHFDYMFAAEQVEPMEAETTERVRKWINGVRAVRSELFKTLEGLGLIPIDDSGAFDPTRHEAVGSEASDQIPSGNIKRTVTLGWQLHGKVLRPARVILSK